MIRKESLKKLSTDKIVPILEKELIQQGFKYLKTKKYFYRNNNNFKEIIDYRLPHKSITFNEDTNQLFLEFYISFSIEHPKYDKWYLTTFDERSHFSYHINRMKGQIELSYEDFIPI